MNIINMLSDNPSLFMFLRKIIELNFIGEKEVLKNELSKMNSNDRVLDLGCGTGELSIFFNNYNYTGIDIEPKYINFAKNKYKGTFKLEDAKNTSFQDQSFDLIVILGVLHHMNDDLCLSVFDEIRRILKISGKILIMEDVNTESKLDIIGNILRKLDKGNWIRTKAGYSDLINSKFNIKKTYQIKSGLISYQVFVLKK